MRAPAARALFRLIPFLTVFFAVPAFAKKPKRAAQAERPPAKISVQSYEPSEPAPPPPEREKLDLFHEPEWRWQQILASPRIGGRLTSVAVDRANPSRIFVGTE